MTYADLAQILQNRIVTGLRAVRVASDSLNQPQRPDLEVYVGTLEKAVAEAEARSERWRQEADGAVKRVASLEANVAARRRDSFYQGGGKRRSGFARSCRASVVLAGRDGAS